MMRVILALWRREIIKFIRDKSRVFGALAQPILFWLLLGLGFQNSFSMAGMENSVSYLEYLYPGIVALMILFTAIFTTISVVEERQEGFLQAALVAPVSRFAFVFGNALGGTTLALLQVILLLLLIPFLGLSISLVGIGILLFSSFLLGISFSALGFAIAWKMETTRGFHAIMNLFLLPMWLLSGAFFPPEGASALLQWCIRLNPVSYTVSAMREGLYFPANSTESIVTLPLAITISLLFALAMTFFAVYTVRKPLYSTSKAND